MNGAAHDRPDPERTGTEGPDTGHDLSDGVAAGHAADRPGTDRPRRVGLSLQGVTISRRGLLLVEDLWLDIAADETVAVMGPSGAGKTTLLRSVAGLTTDFDGRISITAEGSAAVVFQDPRLLPWRTALENVELVCDGDHRDRARWWLTSVGLGDAVDLYPAQMSGGMRQRVAVARALAFDAPIIVVDEPFASLDAATATTLRDDVADHLSALARTVLWVTHDRNEADTVADRILILEGPPTGAWQLIHTSKTPIERTRS